MQTVGRTYVGNDRTVVRVLRDQVARAPQRVLLRTPERELTRAEVTDLAGDEAPMLLAVLLPAGILALAPLFGASVDTAVGLALIVSIGQLFVWGLIVGHAARRGWRFALGVAAVDCLLGVLIVALKVIVIH